MESDNAVSIKEKRIRNLTHIYYSRPEIQKIIFEFSKNREVCPRYFEGFGKRPDTFQYPNDILEMVKKGATSFHCSEEIWAEPLNIQTGMTEQQLNELRTGWDLLIDIDCKWFDYSKKATQAIVETLKQHGVKNIGVKFSGSKGFHILVPWKAFPKFIGGENTKNLFPELPRKIISYLRVESEKYMQQSLPEDFYKQFKNAKIKKGIKCRKCNEIAESSELIELYCPLCRRGEQIKIAIGSKKEKYFCPECRKQVEIKSYCNFFECKKCNINSEKKPNNFSQTIEVDIFDLMGLDIILVSPRHLFTMPYSLHEKTALASIVIGADSIEKFEPMHADAMKLTPEKIKSFSPDAEEGEAKSLVMTALDWSKENQIKQGLGDEEKITGKYADYKPIQLDNILDENFPPCVQKLLEGVEDGRKRAVFILINLLRSIGMDKDLMEKKIYDWNKKNPIPLQEGYIKSQLTWSYRRKPIMPQNCKEFYQGIGICAPDQMCSKIKNPVNYVIRKTLSQDWKKTKKVVEKKVKKKVSEKKAEKKENI